MNYHQGRNSGPNLDGGEEIRTPVNFVHPCSSPSYELKRGEKGGGAIPLAGACA